MGRDKSLINIHGVPQYRYLYDLLAAHLAQTYISCRPEQAQHYVLPVIPDAYTDIGPMAGLLSAFEQDPVSAWLIVACDLIDVDDRVIREIIAARKTEKQATCFVDPATGFPEPLLTIYEPSILPMLRTAFANGQLSLSRVLMACDGHAILPRDGKFLKSMNSPEDL